ncbi:F-box/kelch-repeat protein [Pyrus ussuriensis x Pyrus communis]|uniref:F-box/kelch-repeat protein n=1 Tax=Pyrus ussuriensis x Pyrus communis TaxID=2448454 RepID=A0A5N5G8A4_9ROSA|nr:F-box/kelch-repeat protein [Pyrus ussuriensis x Pyrus communis]
MRKSETPEDKVVEILSRLPPKSLMRFKCIHKSWCTLIKSSSLVAKHLSNSMDNKLSTSTCILLNRSEMPVFPDNSWKYEVLWSRINLSIDSDEHNLQYNVEDLNIPFPMEYHHPTTSDSCLLLPSPPDGKFELETTFRALGFGYDCKAKEYEVVRIIENCEYSDDKQTYHHRISLPYTAEVYYTTTGNSWKEIIDVSITSYCSHYDPSEHSKLFEIWVMDDYDGVKSSWKKLLTVGPLKGIRYPLTLWKGDELLMLASDERATSYNSSAGNLKYLHIPPIIDEVIDFKALIYVKSIVPIK